MTLKESTAAGRMDQGSKSCLMDGLLEGRRKSRGVHPELCQIDEEAARKNARAIKAIVWA